MAGISHSDVDFVSGYDAFTFTTLIELEANGFCGPGEAATPSGRPLQIDHEPPSNLSGGHLSEGYTHGVQMVIENVRQLRHRADDAVPDGRKASTVTIAKPTVGRLKKRGPLRDGVGLRKHGELSDSAGIMNAGYN